MGLVGVDWSRANRTLVLALSTRCHFCTESSEFYRRLTPAAISAGIPVVAVFPQPVEEAQEHWEAQKLPLYGLKFVQAKQLPVSGTPTIILVDRSGTVIRTWAGKQQASGEADIIHNLQQ